MSNKYIERFTRRVKEMAKAHGLHSTATRPWPPYSYPTDNYTNDTCPTDNCPNDT